MYHTVMKRIARKNFLRANDKDYVLISRRTPDEETTMPSGPTISSFVADVVLLGVPQPIILFGCVGLAVPLGYWGMNLSRRGTVTGGRPVRLVAGFGLLALATIMALALAFGRAMPGYEAELYASRDHLRYLPGLLLFGGLCAGFVALVHHFCQPRENGHPLIDEA